MCNCTWASIPHNPHMRRSCPSNPGWCVQSGQLHGPKWTQERLVELVSALYLRGVGFSILHNVTYFPGKLLIIDTFVHSITIDGWDVQQIQSSTIETIKKWCQCIWSVATQTWIWSISYYRMIEKLFVFFPLLALSPGGRNWWQIFANPNQDNFQTACIHAVRRKM